MVSCATRTGTIRPGPQTNSTIGSTPAGTGLFGFGDLLAAAPLSDAPLLWAEPLLTRAASGAGVGKSSISSAARREYTPLAAASSPLAPPAAIMSFASIASVNEKLSSGEPATASGPAG